MSKILFKILNLIHRFGWWLILKTKTPYYNFNYWPSKYRMIIQSRIEFRKSKNYEKADQIRDVLKSEGITIHEDGQCDYCIWGPTNLWERETTTEYSKTII